MPKFGYLGSKFSKTSVRFEISTFEIGYTQNFAMVIELILFGPKFSNFGTWAWNFWKIMSDLNPASPK